MKLYTAPSLPDQILSSIGSDFLMYTFTGEAPVKIEDITFDPNDNIVLSSHAESVSIVKALDSGDILKFINHITTKYPSGVALNRKEGLMQAFPKKFSRSENYLTQEPDEIASCYSNVHRVVYGQGFILDGFEEYEFDKLTTISELHIGHGTVSQSITNFDLMKFESDDWVLAESFSLVLNSHSSYIARVTLTEPQTSTKFRLVAKQANSSARVSSGVEFFHTETPAEASVESELTWFLIKPKRDLGDMFGSEQPIVIGSAGGPNGGKEAAMSHYKNFSGKELKLMNLKIKSKVIGEANDGL